LEIDERKVTFVKASKHTTPVAAQETNSMIDEALKVEGARVSLPVNAPITGRLTL